MWQEWRAQMADKYGEYLFAYSYPEKLYTVQAYMNILILWDTERWN